MRNVIVFGWDHSLPGREPLSAKHFQEFVEFLQAQQKQGAVESFDPVFLEPHGGSFNGFFYIKGEPAKLAALVASPEWMQHQIRATLHLKGVAVHRGLTGPAVGEFMGMWTNAIPR